MKLNRSLTAFALAGVLVLTGCGDDNDKKEKADSDKTSSASSDPTSSGSAETSESSAPQAGEAVDLDEFLDQLRKTNEQLTSAHMTMKMQVMGQNMVGEGDIAYDDGKPAMAMTMDLGSQGSMEMRLVGDAMYMKTAAAGDKWLRMDFKQIADQAGLGDLVENMNPATAFEAYADGFQKVVVVGEDEVGGADTTHYKVTIDTTKVKAFKDSAAAAQLPKTLEYDLWLDEEGRMRKTVTEIPGGGSVEMTMSDFGKDVDVKAPPASEVTEMPGS